MGRMNNTWYYRLFACLLPLYFAIVRLVVGLLRKVRAVSPIPRVSDDILLQSATSIASQIRAGKLTSSEVMSAYIGRIREINPILNCVVQENLTEARQVAIEIDAQVSSGEAPSLEEKPFLGVPFSLKDCIYVRGLVCTAGIPQRCNERASEDAQVVANMREAGAIPLAITNVSEVCMWWEANNGLFGRTRNAYDTRCIVGGSSGGEGCLLSAAGSVFGIGSDIGGSIRMPAYFNGVFGHKPTKGIVSEEGCYPPVTGFHREMHSAGPMCRYAEDLLPMLNVLAGPNHTKFKPFPNVDFGAVKFYPISRGIDSILISKCDSELVDTMNKVGQYFRTRYNSTVDETVMPLVDWAVPIWLNDMQDEGVPTFSEEMANRQGDISPLLELAKLVVGQSVHTVPALCLAVFDKCSRNATKPELSAKLTQMREALSAQIEDLLGEDGVILFPPHPTPVPLHNQPLFTPYNFMYTALFNSLGLPTTCVPMGLGREGTPMGVQIVTNLRNDQLGLAVAREVERAFGGWVNPGSV